MRGCNRDHGTRSRAGGRHPPRSACPPTLSDEFGVTGMLTRISALAFAPNGHLIIMDVGERTVTVTDQTMRR